MTWGAFHQAFCQCFSLTTVISYWNPCIWLAESKFVSEKHWQNAWWNAPLIIQGSHHEQVEKQMKKFMKILLCTMMPKLLALHNWILVSIATALSYIMSYRNPGGGQPWPLPIIQDNMPSITRKKSCLSIHHCANSPSISTLQHDYLSPQPVCSLNYWFSFIIHPSFHDKFLPLLFLSGHLITLQCALY